MKDVFLDILNASLRNIIRDIRIYDKHGVKLQILALITVLANTTYSDINNLYYSHKVLEKAVNDDLFDYLVFADDGFSGIELEFTKEL